MKNFNHIIIPAAISILNEIVAEVQTTEYDAISELYKSIGASDFKFNTLEAKVFPKTTYVLKGQDYEADVFIVASDDTKEFDAKYARGVKDISKASENAISKVSSQKGIVKIKVPTSAIGEQSIGFSTSMQRKRRLPVASVSNDFSLLVPMKEAMRGKSLKYALKHFR